NKVYCHGFIMFKLSGITEKILTEENVRNISFSTNNREVVVVMFVNSRFVLLCQMDLPLISLRPCKTLHQQHAEIERKSVIAVSFIAAFLFLLVVRLVNEVNFPLLLNCFGQPGAKWIPFSYTYRRPLRTHYGYINVRTQEPLQLDCNLCAIVSNSGQMVGQKVGNEIDQSSCIWRMNNAPTKGYEEDVGRMTMIRVVSHTSVPLLLKNPDYFFKEANATIYVIWGPFRNMRKDGNGIVYNMLKKTVDIYPNAQIYVTTEKRMSYCDGVFKKETGKDRSSDYVGDSEFLFLLKYFGHNIISSLNGSSYMRKLHIGIL
ncbi:hypothetical protein MJG53_001888, partial [Ovis ammon polii x Ovis aries]